MSRIFDALQGDEGEHPGIDDLALPSISAELVKNSEPDHPSETQPRTIRSCSSCKTSVPENSLFCPKCEAFLGSVVTEQQCNDDFEQQKRLPDPEPRSSWLRAFWLRIRHFLAFGAVVVLVVTIPLRAC